MDSLSASRLKTGAPQGREADPLWTAGDRAQRVGGRHG